MMRVGELYEHVKRYCLHRALSELGIIGMKIFKNDQSISHLFPRTINEWQLAFIAKALILNSNDYKKEEFGDKGLFDSARLYNNLYEKLLDIRDDYSQEQKNEAGNSFLIRLANQQFPFQVKVRHLIPRLLYLFDEIPKSLKNPDIDIGLEIKKIYGLTPRHVVTVGFAIFAKAYEGYFNPEHLINTESPELQKYLKREAVGKLVNALTADYDKLRELFRKDEGEDGLQQYSFNALRTYPLVKTQIAGIVIPVPRFVLERITNGIYYSLMDKFRREKSNRFLEFFGKELFERYVGILLSEVYSKDNLINEFIYGKKTIKSPDWIILERNEAILIECKTSGITKESKSWGDVEKLQSDLKLRVVHGLVQMANFVKNINAGLLNRPKLKKIKKFRYVIVTYDRIFLSGGPTIRTFINQELLKVGLSNIEYQVISVDEMENLTPLLKVTTFSKLLMAKSSNSEWSTYDFDLFMLDFLKQKGLVIDTDNKLLEKKYEDFFKEISPSLVLNKQG